MKPARDQGRQRRADCQGWQGELMGGSIGYLQQRPYGHDVEQADADKGAHQGAEAAPHLGKDHWFLQGKPGYWQSPLCRRARPGQRLLSRTLSPPDLKGTVILFINKGLIWRNLCRGQADWAQSQWSANQCLPGCRVQASGGVWGGRGRGRLI